MKLSGKSSHLAAIVVLVALQAQVFSATLSDFENLSLGSGSQWGGDEWIGDDLSGTLEIAPDPWYPGSTMDLYNGGFSSGGLFLNNTYNDTYGSWAGWAYSNQTDTSSLDWANECSAITGTGIDSGQDNYAVAWSSSYPTTPATELPSIEFEVPGNSFASIYITNTTYGALAMQNGYLGAKQFGGADGNDPDWMLLTVHGEDVDGNPLASKVEAYMADYRFEDNSQDYIITDWTLLDLTPLSAADKLYFRLTSSDSGDYGMNNPAFIAVDHISTTEPILWDNPGIGDWFDSANWDPQTIPQSDSVLRINTGSAQTLADVVVDGGGSITVDGATASASFANLTIGSGTPGALNIRNEAVVNVSGDITVGPEGTIDVGAGDAQLATTIINNGAVNVAEGDTLSFSGSAGGSGSYGGLGTVAFGDQFSPGEGLATVTVETQMVLSPGSTLVCQLGGEGQCDEILVDNQLTITGGNMKLDWLPGDTEDSMFGGEYTLATYVGNAIPDEFELENGSGEMLGNIGADYIDGIDHAVDLGEGNYAIVVELHGLGIGDVDLDGTVGPQDLAAFGLAWSPAATDKTWFDGDFDFTGNVGPADLAAFGLAWAPNGIAFPAETRVSVVPEPTTAIMLLIAAGGLLLVRGRR